MSSRRVVRVARSFFDRLDELLPAQRTASGGPSATDLLLHEVEEVPEVRVFVTAGRLIARLSVYCILADDDSVEVVYLELAAS